MKKLLLLLLFFITACNDVQLGVGSLIRYAQDYPLNSNAVLGYNKIITGCDPGDAWDCWWYFDGTNDALFIADAPIWEWDSNIGTWIVGIRPDFSGGNVQYLLHKVGGYFQSIVFTPANPGANPRIHRASVDRVVGGGPVSDQNGDLQFPGENTLLTAKWTQGPPQCSYGRFFDSVPPSIGGFTCGGGNFATEDSDDPLYIGARKPAGAIVEVFEGRIFFVAWWKGTSVPGLTLLDIYDGVVHPQDVVPAPDFYMDMSKETPAVTYTSETGGYVWTVVGDPVLNGP